MLGQQTSSLCGVLPPVEVFGDGPPAHTHSPLGDDTVFCSLRAELFLIRHARGRLAYLGRALLLLISP